ncbi:MAG: endo-1,4-beta-xylanase [Kiritimatiellae bacterium]|nr:endo-1,4-beta-xylanase [Kiritimatiellia bacterium]
MKSYFPIGMADHPLLFDRDLNPKPAFHRIVRDAGDNEAD